MGENMGYRVCLWEGRKWAHYSDGDLRHALEESAQLRIKQLHGLLPMNWRWGRTG